MNRFRSMFFSIQIFRALALAAASGRRGSAFWRTKGCGTSCENTASCGFNHLRWHPHRDPIFPIFPNIPSPLNHHRCLSPFLLIYSFERIIIFRLIRNRMRCPRFYLSKDEISRNFVENYVEIHSIFLQWLINYGDPFSQENEQTVILLYRKKRFSRQEEDKSIRITSLCSFIKTLLGIVVTEKAATRMKFDAVSSKAVGTISDYQQPRQSRVFGKSSFVIRTVSADYECLAQALRYAHPLPLLLTRSVFSRSSMILCHSFQLFSFELARLSTSFEFIVLIFYLGNLLLFSISRAKLLFSFNERLVIARTPWISKLGVEKWRR